MHRDRKRSNDLQASYFITFNVVDWVDIFVRPAYKRVIAESLNEYINSKGLVVYAWCLMSNHLHLVAQAKPGVSFTVIIRQLKKCMAQRIMEVMEDEPDLRKEWMLKRFENFSQCLKRIEKHPLWQDCNHPIHIEAGDRTALLDHVRYVHENPIRDGIVESPEEYLYSSARDYAGGMKGMVHIRKIAPLPGEALPFVSSRFLHPENMN